MKLINLALNSFGETYHGLRNRVPTQLAKNISLVKWRNDDTSKTKNAIFIQKYF